MTGWTAPHRGSRAADPGAEPREAVYQRSGARSVPRDLRLPSSGRSERAAVLPVPGFPVESRRHPLATLRDVLRRHARPGLTMMAVGLAGTGTGLLMGDALPMVVGVGAGVYGFHLGVR